MAQSSWDTKFRYGGFGLEYPEFANQFQDGIAATPYYSW